MKFKLPLWNGVKNKHFKQKIIDLELLETSDRGIFKQKNTSLINYEKNYTHMTSLNWKGFINKIRNKKAEFITKNIKNARECLEIGAGDGHNIKILSWKNYTICDPFLQSEKKKNIEIIGGFFENIKFNKKYDTIIMFAVLEHCKNFNIFLKKAKQLLKPNGSMFIEIPIIEKHFLNGDFNCLLHEHTNYFSSKGIIQLLNKHKLNVKNFYFKNDAAYLYVSNTYKKNKNIFFDGVTHRLNYYNKIFKKKASNFKIFLKKNKDKNIVFYGANNGLNTLLYFVSKDKNIHFKKIHITDGDKNKWGKYIGSLNEPIKNPKIISKCDLICVSALSFSDEIISSLDKKKPIINLNDI